MRYYVKIQDRKSGYIFSFDHTRSYFNIKMLSMQHENTLYEGGYRESNENVQPFNYHFR